MNIDIQTFPILNSCFSDKHENQLLKNVIKIIHSKKND